MILFSVLLMLVAAWADPKVPAEFLNCQTELDCIEVPKGKCDCGGLGKNISIRKDRKQQWLLMLSESTSTSGRCLAALSKDWSCWHFLNQCKVGKCILEPIPIPDFSKAKESDCDDTSLDKVNRNACLLAIARRERLLPLCLKMDGPDTDQLKGGNTVDCLKMVIDEIPIKLLKKSLCSGLEWNERQCLFFVSQKLNVPMDKIK